MNQARRYCVQCRYAPRAVARFCPACGASLADLPPNSVVRLSWALPDRGFDRRWGLRSSLSRVRYAAGAAMCRQAAHRGDGGSRPRGSSASRRKTAGRRGVAAGQPQYAWPPRIFPISTSTLSTSTALVIKYIDGQSLQRLLMRRADPLPVETAYATLAMSVQPSPRCTASGCCTAMSSPIISWSTRMGVSG